MQISDFLNKQFVEQLMRTHAPEKNIQVLEVIPLSVDNSASILSVLTAGRSARPIGHFGLRVTFLTDGVEQTKNMVMKIKPHGREIVEMLYALAQGCGENFANVYAAYKELTGFQHTHMRELEVYSKLPSAMQPIIYGLYADPGQEFFVILMEYLQEVELLNTVMAPEQWSDSHIREALRQMATWHAAHLGKKLPLDKTYWDDAPSAAYMLKMQPLWEALLTNAASNFPDLYTPERVKILKEAIDNIPQNWAELAQMPKTLVHNDFNPRNTCFKREGDAISLCLYDWELATWHVPQYDLVELLSFVLDGDRYDERECYKEFYRQELARLSGYYSDKEQFEKGFALAALDFGLHRLGMYMMAHTVSPYPFLPRVVNSYFDSLYSAESNHTKNKAMVP